MLLYLDNARSGANPGQRTYAEVLQGSVRPARGRGVGRIRQNQRRAGLNENYARELLELHTLGVDGGYTQQDVIEVARALTGWSIDQRRGAFAFRPAVHDADAKLVLGHRLPAGR